jgi:hypothetical protein
VSGHSVQMIPYINQAAVTVLICTQSAGFMGPENPTNVQHMTDEMGSGETR